MLLAAATAAILLSGPIVTIDGDTIDADGRRIRIANIDAPELRTAKCDAERRLGLVAKHRLEELLASGPVTLTPGDPRDGRTRDRHGRVLGTLSIDGRDVGQLMIRENLARPWTGRREPWCEHP